MLNRIAINSIASALSYIILYKTDYIYFRRSLEVVLVHGTSRSQKYPLLSIRRPTVETKLDGVSKGLPAERAIRKRGDGPILITPLIQ